MKGNAVFPLERCILLKIHCGLDHSRVFFLLFRNLKNASEPKLAKRASNAPHGYSGATNVSVPSGEAVGEATADGGADGWWLGTVK